MGGMEIDRYDAIDPLNKVVFVKTSLAKRAIARKKPRILYEA
jgi:hypothetical protein